MAGGMVINVDVLFSALQAIRAIRLDEKEEKAGMAVGRRRGVVGGFWLSRASGVKNELRLRSTARLHIFGAVTVLCPYARGRAAAVRHRAGA